MSLIQRRISRAGLSRQSAKGSPASAATYGYGVDGGSIMKLDLTENEIALTWSNRDILGFDRAGVKPGQNAGTGTLTLIDREPLYYTDIAERFSTYDFRTVAQALGHLHAIEKLWQDPRGRTYYWMTYAPPYHLEGPETDVTSLCEGYITVTPLHFDLTRHDLLSEVGRWNWDGAGTFRA